MSRGHTRNPCTVLLTGVSLLALIAGTAGCESEPPHRSARISKNYDGRFINTITYDSFGTTSELNCADGKSLNVTGSNNRLTVRGRCATVTVAGADNRITVEQVDSELTISGINNAVTYRGGGPKLDDQGSGNTITNRR
ncbi:DUF3060 domain-containing protein [[Mycobacterium] vasticus]|uniref:DUF3060 domain-containing protein n=1 Tax=[Mycobacterium] vasticus TaxID=2875777 RepID=A0ABU5YY83_9MYCO|nr:DUF3060 domain-containing protein [Mycolicibacter sp. MYC017]MEB3070101.1 DUF3060 domain-containing protein [Mycolicibacter sp. MYC017]